MINLKYNRIKALRKSHGKDSAGFTLFELLIVMSIISVVVTLAGMSLSAVYHARAKSAAETVSAMISQCKVNNLSGKDTELELHYDSDNDFYVCELVDASEEAKSKDRDMRTVYKTEIFGNERLALTVNDAPVSGDSGVVIKFSTSSGAVDAVYYGGFTFSDETAGVGSNDYVSFSNYDVKKVSSAPTVDAAKMGGTAYDFVLSSGSTFTVTLYKATGAQVNDWEAD